MDLGNKIELPTIIAHRGASGSAPENTLAALYAAKAFGAKWVEIDVKMAGCGELVVIHNNDLSMTTNGHGLVGKTNYTEISKLDAGAWFSEKFRGERVPRLIDVIECLVECQLGVNFELKPERGKEAQMVKRLIIMLNQHWPSHLPTPLISSFSVKCLRKIRALDDNMLIGLLTHYWAPGWKRFVSEIGCISVHSRYQRLKPKKIQAIKDRNCRVLAYTVNSIEQAKRLFNLGVDAIITDHPQHFLQLPEYSS